MAHNDCNQVMNDTVQKDLYVSLSYSSSSANLSPSYNGIYLMGGSDLHEFNKHVVFNIYQYHVSWEDFRMWALQNYRIDLSLMQPVVY